MTQLAISLPELLPVVEEIQLTSDEFISLFGSRYLCGYGE